jgi:Na+-transporting methylmalonyl-CoA/oxaloacetate decarboxylase gamma subunit
MLLIHHEFPKKISAFLGISVFFITYVFWMFFARFVSGVWIYPDIKEFGWSIRILGITVVILFLFYLHCLVDLLNRIVWWKVEKGMKILEMRKEMQSLLQTPRKFDKCELESAYKITSFASEHSQSLKLNEINFN